MSETKLRKHPCVIAWEKFMNANPESFLTPVESVYLKNRLQGAFEQGWSACIDRIERSLAGVEEVSK